MEQWNFEEDRPAVWLKPGGFHLDLVMALLGGVRDGPILRAILRGVAVIPLRDAEAAGVIGCGGFEWCAERDRQPVAVRVPGDGQLDRLAGEAHALQRAVARGA